MPKAEAGSTKFLANKMKAKGLQRLRWYCQICEKQCRDENGFKQHTMSESHVRAMIQVGEDPKKFINEYSNQFKRDFLLLLKTSHGEKRININHFYQEYIRDKEHIHMNASKWPSLTEFAKFLGREGLCRVEEGDKGLEISFIDDSPDAVRRREDVKRKEQQKQGDEDVEARLLEEQIKRAREAAAEREKLEQQQKKDSEPVSSAVVDEGPVKVSISLGAKTNILTSAQTNRKELPKNALMNRKSAFSKSKPKDDALPKSNDDSMIEPEKKMSNAERIMKEEMARKRLHEQRGIGGGVKRQRFS